MTPNPAPPALELRGIVKRFPPPGGTEPGVLANDHVDLAVERGEIRALLGENGAGKTTLMRVLYGLYPPDAGEIFLDGTAHSFRSPTDAIAAGLGMVHQHFMLFPTLTVAENVVFGHEPRRRRSLFRGLLDRRAARRRVAELAEGFRLEVDPRARVVDLPVGLRQRVEILKILHRRARVLIFDEPTAVLTPPERDALFQVLRRLAAEGRTIVFITHKLREVMALADRATVLRDGKVTATVRVADSSPRQLCRHMVGRDMVGRDMVGRDVMRPPEKTRRHLDEVVLRVEDLEVRDALGRRAVDGVGFEVRAGEIVGIAAVAGNGQSELISALAGLRPISAGRVWLAGRDLTRASVAARRRAGLAYVPEDTGGVGLALDASIADNLIMGRTGGGQTENRRTGGGQTENRHVELTRRGVLSRAGIRELATRLIERFAIKAASADIAARHLSGGNRQKVVVARELSRSPVLLIAEQPTQGVDVGAAQSIRRQLVAAGGNGRAVLLVSADLGELTALADRILVMFEGRIAGEAEGGGADEQTLGLLAAGGKIAA